MPAADAILIVEDDATLAESLAAVLRDEGHKVDYCEDGAEGYRRAAGGGYALVVTDYRLPGMGGMELLERLRDELPRLPVVMMTSHGTADLAIGASKVGAFEYLIKPFDIDEFLRVVERGLRAYRAGAKKVKLGAAPGRGGGMVGSGRAMQEVFKEIGRAAPTDAGVLIVGETGTGKELVARALHQHSRRAAGPFVAVNCGAIPENLLESELFGHRRGAFTGAVADRPGRFEQAQGGTIFLDELGEMPLSVQVKLLRVLQDKKVQPLGSTGDVAVDARVVAATNRDLEGRIAQGEFRSDLYFRLNTVVIELPPLRDRRDDIPALVEHFAAAAAAEFGVGAASFPNAAMKLLEAADWPGNIRQLENAVRRAVLTAAGGPVDPAVLRAAIGQSAGAAATGGGGRLGELVQTVLDEAIAGDGDAHRMLVEEVERELFEQALERARGNQSRAAEWLGLSRVTLRAKLRKHGIEAGRGG